MSDEVKNRADQKTDRIQTITDPVGKCEKTIKSWCRFWVKKTMHLQPVLMYWHKINEPHVTFPSDPLHTRLQGCQIQYSSIRTFHKSKQAGSSGVGIIQLPLFMSREAANPLSVIPI